MFIRILVIILGVLGINGKLWVIYGVSFIVSLIFVIMELCELWRIQKNVNKIWQNISQKQQKIQNMHVKNKKGCQSTLQINFTHKFHKILTFFTYFPKSPKSVLSTKNYHFIIPAIKQQQQTNLKMEYQQLQLPNLLNQQRKAYEVKILYIKMLMYKIIREFFIIGSYAIVVLAVVGIIGNNEQQTNKQLENQTSLYDTIQKFICWIQQKMSKNYFIYILPMLINSIWKSKRIKILFCSFSKKYDKNNQQKLKYEQEQSQPSYTFINSISDIQSKPISSITLLLQLLNIQSITQILCTCYILIHCLLQINCIILAYFWIRINYLYHSKNYDIIVQDDIKYIMRNICIILASLCYLIIKDWYSIGKPIGIRYTLWQIHLLIDKLLKYTSIQLRKEYHKKIVKIVTKLTKYKIVYNSKQKICTKNSIYKDINQIDSQIYIYYQCL